METQGGCSGAFREVGRNRTRKRNTRPRRKENQLERDKGTVTGDTERRCKTGTEGQKEDTKDVQI